MEEIKETLEYQSDLIRAEYKDSTDKEKKELLKLAWMAVDEAVNYLEDLDELNSNAT